MAKKNDQLDINDPAFLLFESLLCRYFCDNYQLICGEDGKALWFTFDREYLCTLFRYEYSTGEELGYDQIGDAVIPNRSAYEIDQQSSSGFDPALDAAFHRTVREVRVRLHGRLPSSSPTTSDSSLKEQRVSVRERIVREDILRWGNDEAVLIRARKFVEWLRELKGLVGN